MNTILAQDAVEIRTDLSMLILLGVIAALIYLATKLSARGLLAMFGCGFLVLVVMCLSYARMESHVEDAHNIQAVGGGAPDHTEHAYDSAHLSTEEMWEHFSQPRIPLSDAALATDETEDKPAKSPTAEPAKSQKRPAWVDIPPKRVGNVYRVAIASGPYRDVEECHQALVPELLDQLYQRVAQLTDNDRTPSLGQLGFGPDFVLREICREEWTESMEQSFGEMKQVHVLMEFDTATDKHLRGAIRDYQRRDRITQVGGFAGLGLGSMALLFGLLKVDTWTKGYYTKRLFLGVPAVIIGLVLLNFA